MTPEKRQKIQAMLDDKSSTPNEKEICRKLLKDNPEDIPRRPRSMFEGGLGSIFGGSGYDFRDAKSKSMDDLLNDLSGFGGFGGLGGFGGSRNFGQQAAQRQQQAAQQAQTVYWLTCEHCKNQFTSLEIKLYCEICLKAKQREAGND